MHDPARGFDQFRKCLPRLLELRPNCLVVLAWLDIAQTGLQAGQRRRYAIRMLRDWQGHAPRGGYSGH